MTNTVKVQPSIHVLPAPIQTPGRHRVMVREFPAQSLTEATWIGTAVRIDIDEADSEWRAMSRSGHIVGGWFPTSELAGEALGGFWLDQLQTVELTVVLRVDREMWDLAYGEMDEAGREEDVRSYVAAHLWETAQSRPGGEGGISDVDVDMR